MEGYQDDSTDNDNKLKRSFESYRPDTEEEKKKEKAKKKKRAEEQATREKKRSQAADTEAGWFSEKKPSDKEASKGSLLDVLIGDESADEKSSEVPKKSEKSEASAQETEASAETTRLEELSPDEQREATAAYIAEREARLAAESAQAEQSADAVAAQEVAANQSFLQRVKSKLRGEADRSPDELLDEAADETVLELSDDAIEPSEETEEPDVEQSEATETDPGIMHIEDRNGEETDEELPATTNQPATHIGDSGGGSVIPPAPPAGGSGAGGADSVGPLPATATPSTDSSGGGGGVSPPVSSLGGPNLSGPSGAEAAPATVGAAREAAASGFEQSSRRRGGAGEFLLGAFVGYLFGRRRGRLSAEAEHEPVKRKLEQEVQQLQTDIESREARVRTAARQESASPDASAPQAEQPSSSHSEATAEKPQPAPVEAVGSGTKSAPERTPVDEAVPTDVTESQPDDLLSPEAPVKPPIIESVAAATATKEVLSSPENSEKQAETIARQVSPETIATMPLPQVLEHAERISYHGESLRDMYETDRLDERTLRETLKAFQAGERYEQRLERGLRQLREAAVSVEAMEQQREQATTYNQPTESQRQSAQEHVTASSTLPPEHLPTNVTPSNDQDLGSFPETHHRGVSPMKQATIGAIIGIVFVIIIIFAFGFN
jgi:hypothetical protein